VGDLRRLDIGKNVLVRIAEMNKTPYRVVRHDGGWAFEANGTRSTGFRTREAARNAARLAAGPHSAGKTAPLSYETVTRQDDSG
jgi:hypothetical protein